MHSRKKKIYEPARFARRERKPVEAGAVPQENPSRRPV
jgi:hypothetical protein